MERRVSRQSVIADTLQRLRERAAYHDRILVGYSGGKDSRATLQLCVSAFRHVECFITEFVPGLDIVEREIAWARARWSLPPFRRYTAPSFFMSQQQGLYCEPVDCGMRKLTQRELLAAILRDSGHTLMALGQKETDFWQRRADLKREESRDILYPIQKWDKFQVHALLKAHDIPVPDSQGGATTGIGLHRRSILWLHDDHPADYERVREHFPYITAIVAHRDLYGDPDATSKRSRLRKQTLADAAAKERGDND